MSAPDSAAASSAAPLQPKMSEMTREKSLAAKAYLEDKYKNLVRSRVEQRQSGEGSPGEKKESSYQRMLRSKVTVSDFENLTIIGRGAFGEVRIVRKKDSGEVMAMKKLKKSEMLRKNQIQHVRAERDILTAADSDWVVTLHSSFQDDDYLYLVMEYLPGGDMMNWLIAKEIFTEIETKFYMAELVLAVESIHKLGYVHRDLKPDNILLDNKGHIKLSDFGLCKPTFAKEVDGAAEEAHHSAEGAGAAEGVTPGFSREQLDHYKKNRRIMLFSTVGSPGYIAPEVLMKRGYGMECDWWSVGVIMFEMLCGYPPFFSDDPMHTCHKIVRWREFLRFPSDLRLSAESVDLMRRLLCDPASRIGTSIGAEEIKAHPFFRGIDWANIRGAEAPFRPTLHHELDTSYFDKFDEAEPVIRPGAPGGGLGALGAPGKSMLRDENYVFKGYTFKRSDSSRKSAPNSVPLSQMFESPPSSPSQ